MFMCVCVGICICMHIIICHCEHLNLYLPHYVMIVAFTSHINISYLILSLQINAAAEVIYESVDPNANIIFGALVDDSMSGEIAITVIATGFPVYEDNPQQQVPPPEEPITTGRIHT